MWKFEVYTDTGGSSRWRLNASNGRNVASSGESFASHSNAKTAAENFKAKAKRWTYDVYVDAAGKHRWRALSSNGAKVASSGESFYSKTDAQKAADNVRDNAGGASGP